MNEIKVGSKVKSIYGNWYTVVDMFDNCLTVNGRYGLTNLHVSNVVQVLD